jgi:hypothetical protein
MDNKVFEIINYIKKNREDKPNKLFDGIHQFFNINIVENDLNFLIDLVIKNHELSTDILLQIFINYQKKIDHKIIAKKDDLITSQDSNVIYNNIFLNIFYRYGLVFIIPQQIIVLWNEKIMTNKYFSSIFTKSKLYDDTEVIIKYINYDIFNSNNIKVSEKEKKYDYYMRKIGLKQYKFGFQTKFQLMVPLEVEKIFLSVMDLYNGKIEIYFNNKSKQFILKEKKDLQNIIEYFKGDLIEIYKKSPDELQKHLYMFFEDPIFMNYLDIVFDTLKFTIKFIKKKPLEEFIYLTKPKVIKDIQLIEPCLHENLLNNIISKDFFNSINKFIEEYVYFSDSIAICKICSEILPSLFIKENLYIDKDKYIVNFNNDILQYDPYNKFSNVKIYFENIFYLFTYYTKLSFSIDSNFIIRLCLDTFIYINSERLTLEKVYKKDIEEGNIFFLRLSNTFFEIDNEREKYKEKKTIFTIYVIFIIIICTLSIQDFNEIIFRRKLFILSSNPNFEEILCVFIDFLFKKFNYDYYGNDKLKRSRITRTIEIFYELFNDETKYIYQNKKVGLENFLIKKKSLTINLDIPEIKSSYYFDYYNDICDNSKQINTNICQYNTDIYSIDSDIKYINIYNYYDKTNNILYIDFNIIINDKNSDKQVQNKHLLDILLKEFNEKDKYLYIDQIYSIQAVNDYYILYNDNNILIKYPENLTTLETLNNTDIFWFFIIYDSYVYKQEVRLEEFLDILINYINFIEKYYNISIISNILKCFNKESIYTRYNIFYYKIQILNTCEKLLNKNNLYKKFKYSDWHSKFFT